MWLLLVFLMSMILSLALMPVGIKVGINIGFVDKPTKRKQHAKPIPHLGGVIIYLCYFIAFFAFNKNLTSIDWGFCLAATIVVVIGTYDDWYKSQGKELSWVPKAIFQIIASTILFLVGVRFRGFINPLDNKMIIFPIIIQYLFTIIWIFGVVTVINFTDGLDGLAGGIAVISSTTLCIVAFLKGQTDSVFMCIILIGVVLGYLKYNRHPAKIFMGDAGATFIGFVLAFISLDGVFKQATAFSLLIPVLALGVPIFDNIYVVIKRYLNGIPVYKADRSQLHYRLLDRGLGVKDTGTYIFLMSICCSLTSIIIALVSLK